MSKKITRLDLRPYRWARSATDSTPSSSEDNLIPTQTPLSGSELSNGPRSALEGEHTIHWKQEEDMTQTVREILDERAQQYGDFRDVAQTSQTLKAWFATPTELEAYMHEALDMIASKIARIVHGDSRKLDTWQDIAGYAQLVVDQLQKESSSG